MGSDYSAAVSIDCNLHTTRYYIPVFPFSFQCGIIFKDETTTKINNVNGIRQIQISPDALCAQWSGM